MRTSGLFALLLVTLLGFAMARDVPNFIHVCKRNNPQLDACMAESVEYLRPYLKEGVPEYNIPSLEPLLLKELIAAEGTGIKVYAKDVKVYGASNFSVNRLKVDLNKLRFDVDIGLPNILVQGLYEIDGRVLLLPIKGSGPMTGNFTNCIGAVKVQTQLQKMEDGQDHMKIADFRMKITVGKGTLKLDNLFGGDPVLGDAINSAINKNFDAFLWELLPIVERALSDAFLQIGNSIVTQFTFEQLFPTA